MVLKIENDEPGNLTEAIYLLDRNRLQVAGAKTRDEAIAELREEYGEDGDTEELEDEDADDEYDDMTNDDLREELEDRGLDTSGNKPDLVARLREDDAEEF